MRLGLEIKDFIAGYNSVKSWDERKSDQEDAAAKRDLMKAQTEKLRNGDPLDKEYKQAQIDYLRRGRAIDPADTELKRAKTQAEIARAGYYARKGVEAPEDNSAFETSMEGLSAGDDAPEVDAGGEDGEDWAPSFEQPGSDTAVDPGAEASEPPAQALPYSPEEGPPPANPRAAKARAAIDEGQPGAADTSAFEAIKQGALYGAQTIKQSQPGAVDTGEGTAATTAYLSGEGAVPPPMMEEVLKKIDPEGRMGEEARNMQAYQEVWKYFNDKGDPDAAKRATFQMLQFNRKAANQHAAIAKAAVQSGDIDGAAKAIVRAYGNIPDGNALKLTKTEGGYQFDITDVATGESIKSGTMSPQQLGQFIMTTGPQSFDQQIVQGVSKRAAGGKGNKAGLPDVDPKALAKMSKEQRDTYLKTRAEIRATEETKKPPKPLSYEDRARVDEDIETAFTTLTERAGSPEALVSAGDDIKAAARAVYANPDNGSLSPVDAVDAISDMIYVDEKNPGKPAFTAKVKGDMVTVTTKGRQPIKIPKEQFSVLAEVWESRAQEKITAIGAEAKKAAARAARFDRIKKTFNQAVDAIDFPDLTGGRASRRAQEEVQSRKSDALPVRRPVQAVPMANPGPLPAPKPRWE